MNMIVRGQGGSGKGALAPGSSNEAADTLRSSTTVNLIEALGEGPIVGLRNGGNSIYFDDTPLEDADGTKNFVGVSWDQRTGLPDQTPLPGPAQTSTPFTVETQVKQSTPVIRTIDDSTAIAVQIIMRIPALAAANQNTGDVTGTSVAYLVERRAAGAGWETVISVNINNQKVTSPYNKQHFVPAPNNSGSPWDIRITRLTPDPDPVEANFLQNQTWWQSYATIVSGQFTYDDTALISLYVDAFLFGANVGTRSYHVRGLIIDVPSNYDPINKTYSGIWDGTFKPAWTSNPAWIFWDLLTNTRYGIGEFVQIASVDKWSLYQIGQYCDALVPSGFKDVSGNDILEPRFAFNGVINTRDEAYTVLQSLAAAFRGMAYWSLGQVFCSADMPSDPVCAITPANVIDGHFKYSGTAMKARHSVAVITWNDPNNYWRQTPEVVQDDDQIRRFGWRQTDVTLMGCTSRGQANRYGKWILDTEKNQTETVQFSMSWDGYVLKDNQALKPGDIILLTDPRKNGNFRAGGRLAQSISTTSVVLDFPFLPETGQTYTISALMPDGVFVTKIISSFGVDHKTITLSEAFPNVPVVAADFIIQSADMVARQYRVMAVQEDGENLFKVTALIHDPAKFARVEQNLALDPIPYVRPRNVISKVTDVTGSEARFFQNGVSHSRVTISWTGPNDFQVADYLLTADSPHGFVNFNSSISPTLDVLDATPGAWTFYIVVRSITGATSTVVSFPLTVQGWEAVNGPVPDTLKTTDGGTTFHGRAPTITWNNVFPANYVQYDVKNVVRVYDSISNTLLHTEQVTTPTYTYTYEQNVNDGGPRRAVRIDITALNVTGTESAPASIIVSNPVPAKVVPTLQGDVGSIDISWINNDADYAGALVWVSTNSGFVPTLSNFVYDGPDTKTVAWVSGGTQYVWVSLYDAFGKVGLILSDPQHLEINDLQSTLAAVLPNLETLKNTPTLTDIANIEDVIASIQSEIIKTRDANDSHNQTVRQILAVQDTGLGASISTEQDLRVAADFAEAALRQVLAVNVGAVSATLATESVTRATNDTAEATARAALAVSLNSAISAAVATETTARVTADSAIASSVSSLTTTVGTNTANISTVTTSVNGVKVQYGVIGTINGITGGFSFTGIQKLDGSVNFAVEIQGSLIVNGTISAAKLNVTSLSAVSANVGTVTAGMIRSANNLVRFDLTNATLIVADS
jgi:predicted phage tail protein